MAWRGSRLPTVLAVLPVMLVVAGFWPWLALEGSVQTVTYWAGLTAHWRNSLGGVDLDWLRRVAKTLLWYELPGWPMAVWAFWSWRREIRATHILLPAG